MFGLSPDAIRDIKGVFAACPRVQSAIIYGSRAKGNYRKNSDIDLTFQGNDMDMQDIYSIYRKIDELNLPYMFDFSVFDQIENPDLVDHIRRVGRLFYQRENVLPEEWKIGLLGEVAEIRSGNSAPQKREVFVGGKYPFCRTSDVGKVHISNNFKEIQDFLNEEGIKGLTIYRRNTILFPKSGASTFLNHRVMLAVESYVSSHLATIYADEKILLPKFLFYILMLVDARELTNEQSYPSLKLSEIAQINIPIPPLSEQKRIVAILDKTLGAVSKAIANTEKNIENTRELFNSRLSNLLSNKKCQIVEIGDIADLGRGRVIAKKYIMKNPGPYPVYSSQTRNKGKFGSISIFDFEGEYVTWTTDGANAGTVFYRDGKFNCTNVCGTIKVKDTNKISTKYLALVLNTKTKPHVSVASGNPKLMNNVMSKIKIPLPPLEVQKQIVAEIDTLSEKIKKLEKTYRRKTENLKELRQSLMQKAFKGELV